MTRKQSLAKTIKKVSKHKFDTSKYIAMGEATPNEVRKRLGKKPLPSGTYKTRDMRAGGR
jgi:hypothetical protein